MKKTSPLNPRRGFTLVEIIAVLAIIGILVAIAIPRYLDLTAEVTQKGIQAAIAELNGREAMTWAKEKLKTGGWTGDGNVFTNLDTNLGADYNWTAGPDVGGGTLGFKGATRALNRSASQDNNPAKWQ